MDVFSSIKNVTQKTQNYENMTNTNRNVKDTFAKGQSASEKMLDEVLQNGKTDKTKLKKELEKITQELNKALNPLNTTLKFRFNDKIKELTIEVVDVKKNEVIRKFPSEEALRLMEKMREIVGILFDKKG